MTLDDKIAVMMACKRGEEIECRTYLDKWIVDRNPSFRWEGDNYRIKPKPKQVVVIEKWLCKDIHGAMIIIDGNVEAFLSEVITKVKLLNTYEVEI